MNTGYTSLTDFYFPAQRLHFNHDWHCPRFYESFFEQVPVTDFLFGLKWYPQIAIEQIKGFKRRFWAVPVFAGTFLIAFIAMVIAGPIGLFSAIYFSEYYPITPEPSNDS